MALVSLASTAVYAAAPTNDNFSAAQVISGDFGTVTADNTGAGVEPGEPNHADWPAAASLWYKWTANADGPVQFDTFGSGIDTLLGVYTGTSVDRLSMLVANDIGGIDVEPSLVKFYAKQGATYYIAVDGWLGDQGPVSLSWAYLSAGVFRFNTDAYVSTEIEGFGVIDIPTSIHTEAGIIITVVRDAGSVGRVQLTFDTLDDSAVEGMDYLKPANTTLTMENNEMSKSFVIRPLYDGGLCTNYKQFSVVLTDVKLDPEEALNIQPPRINPAHSAADVYLLDFDFNPYDDPTNCPTILPTVNLEHAHFIVDEPIGEAVLYVYRFGGPEQCRIGYSIDSSPAYTGNLIDNGFETHAGSEYATPDPVNQGPPGISPDFLAVQGELVWGTGDYEPKPITIPIYNDDLVEFNEDLVVRIYPIPGASDNAFPGMITEAIVTILYDDFPAGMLDLAYNRDLDLLTDPPANSNPGANNTVYGMVVQPDNKTVIVGNFSTYNAWPRNGIVRILEDGQIDQTLNPGDGVPVQAPDSPSFISCIALGQGGKMVIGGNFPSYNGTARYNIAQINADGSLDQSFNPGLGANGTVWAVAVQPDGKVLLGGEFSAVNGVPRSRIARLNFDGSVDMTFNPGVPGIDGTINAIASASDGSVFIGGDFANVGGLSRNSIAKLSTNGVVTPLFNPGTGVDGPVYTLALQPDGRLLLGGAFKTVALRPRSNIARLNADGSLDTSFDPGRGTDDAVYTLALQSNGRILVGGLFTSVDMVRRTALARLFATGELDTSFMDTSYNELAGLHKSYYNPDKDPKNFLLALGLQGDGNVVIGGSFHYVSGGRTHTYIMTNLVSPSYFDPYARVVYRVRNNVARLLGGQTEGPGSMGFVQDSYSVDENMDFFYVKVARGNGSLGRIESTFSLPPRVGSNTVGIAESGVDYVFNRENPTFIPSWAATRCKSFGMFGTNTLAVDPLGIFWNTSAEDILITIPDIAGLQGDRSAPLQLDMPSCADVFFLGGQNMPLGSALGKRTAMLTVKENDVNPGVIGFSTPVYYVSENGTNALITLTRTNGSVGPVSVTFATTNGTAFAGTNYVGFTNTITFRDKQTSTNINIKILNDSLVQQADRTVSLYLSNPKNGATIGLTNAVLNIIDDDFQPGRINFTPAAYVTNETAPAVILTVTRTGGNQGVLDVQYASANSSAAAGVNYTATAGSFHWDDGDTSPRFITVPLLHDGVVTPDKSFTVGLFNASITGALGSRTNATITIANEDFYGRLQFSAASYNVNENGGYATITVTRTGGSAETVSANFTTLNGTALAGVNYVATNGTLRFGPGKVSDSFNVRILDDGSPDPSPFLFNLQLSGFTPPGVSVGGVTNAFVNIVDVQSFTRPPGMLDAEYKPEAGFNDDVYAIALQPDGKLLAAGNFTVANGLSMNRMARLNDDGSLDQTFMYLLPGPNSTVRAMISQSDTRVVIGGSFTTVNGVVRNFIARLNYDGSLDTGFKPGSGGDAPVYALAETFVGGPRKILVGGAFNSFNGALRAGIVRLNADGTVDPAFNNGAGANGTVYAVAVYPTNTVHAGKVVIGGDFTAVNGIARARVARLNLDGSVDLTFNPGSGADDTVRALAIQSDGKVLAGGAFTNLNGTALNHIARLNGDGSVDSGFAAGVGANDVVYTIALQPDNRILLGGEFTRASGVTRSRITRLLPSGAVDPTINFGTGANNFISSLAVQENGRILIAGGFTEVQGQPRGHLARLYGGSMAGSGSFQFEKPIYLVDEVATNVTVTIVRTGGTSGPQADGTGDIAVSFATSDGTAVANVNYSNVTARMVFPVGETMQSLVIPVIDDQQITPDLTANLALFSPTPPSTLGRQPTATLRILNNNSSVSFSSSTYARAENAIDGAATIDLIRVGGTRFPASVVFMTTTNGTAIPNVNYAPVSNVVTFLAGQTNASVKVPVLRVAAAQGDTTVGLVLTNTSGMLLVSPSEATLTIVDVDQAAGQLYFASPTYFAGEGDGWAMITVGRTNGRSGIVSVSYSTGTGTATPGLKYIPTNGILSFIDGETSKAFAVQVLEENQVEGNQTLDLFLSNPTGGATVGGVNPALLTIIDNDVGVAFSSPVYAVSETNGLLTLNVLRLSGTNGVTRVDYATTNGTALAGINYQPISGTLTFNPGESFKSITVPIIYDPTVTGNLSFNVNLSNPTGGAQLAIPSSAIISVQDVDSGVKFFSPAYSVLKNGTNAIISVLRTNADTGLIRVNYATTDGTAVAGVDYTATSGVLVFTNGQTSNWFSVPIINNNLVQGDRDFSISLFNATAPAQVLEPSLTTVTIVDNQSGLRFSSPTYFVTQNGVAATILVDRTGYTNSTVSVTYNTVDGTAKAGIDYAAVTGTLVFTNGETRKSFIVPVIDNTIIQPDKTVLLNLVNPVGLAVLLDPSAATLTIRNVNGSLVSPAGSALVSESGEQNRALDPGETVEMLLALRVSAGTNTANLVATLLPTNGIASPSGSQNYGALAVGGRSVSRPFTFTANATNGQQIIATLQLADNGRDIGTAVFSFVVGSASSTFTNLASIRINDFNPQPQPYKASPYPAPLNVTGVDGVVSKVTVSVNSLNHSSAADVAMLLVSPGAQASSLLMANAGGNGMAVSRANVTFDDGAAGFLPQSAPISSGSYKPSGYPTIPPFPSPAPPGPYNTTLSSFRGVNPNGQWSLYVLDDLPLDSGIISNGWSLKFTTINQVIGAADLGLAMTAAPSPVVATSNLVYTISIANYGPAGASNVVVTDQLPANATYVSNTRSQGTASVGAGSLTWNVGSLAVDQVATMTLIVRPGASGSVSNYAAVAALSPDLNPDNDSARTLTPAISPTADVQMLVVDGPDPVPAGATLQYAFYVTNSGPATATAVMFTNRLPAGVNFLSVVPSQGAAGIVGNTVWASLGAVSAEGQAVVNVTVRPMVGGTITNTATASSPVIDPLKGNNIASAKTVVLPTQLTAARVGNNLVLTWPDYPGILLESATSLTAPVSWIPVTQPPPTVSGGQRTVTIPIGAVDTFYRVRFP